MQHFRLPKRLISILFLAPLFAVAVTVRATAGDRVEQLPRADDVSGYQTGVPDYSLMTLTGKELRLSALRGRVVLLDFFDANCQHCQKHAPFVADLAKRHGERGLVVVNLASNNPFVARDAVDKYVRDAAITNDVVWAPSELFLSYLTPNKDGIYGVPQAVLFDTTGRVTARFTDWEEADRPRIEQAIVKQLGVKNSK